MNPFEVRVYGGELCETLDAAGRLAKVREFNAAQCRAALALPDLQKAVRVAIERRLRKVDA